MSDQDRGKGMGGHLKGDRMQSSSGVALDFGWLRILEDCESRESDNFSLAGFAGKDDAFKDRIFAEILHNSQYSRVRELLLFAEQLVVSDRFIVDSIAFAARLGTIPKILQPFVALREPAEDVYVAASDEVRRLMRAISRDASQSPELERLTREMNKSGPSEFWSTTDKNFHDYLYSRGTVFTVVASANTDDTMARALFYLEFGRYLGDVPLLSAGKKRWLDLMGVELRASFHSSIAKRFESAVFADLNEFVADAFASEPIPVPPVAELVLSDAIFRGRSILESAVELRETAEATSYRALLSDLRSRLRAGRAGRLQAQRAIGGLKRIAESWRKYNDPRIGVTIRPRTLEFKKLPALGLLLEAAEMSKVEIMDRILSAPPGYLAFMSSWYKKPSTP